MIVTVRVDLQALLVNRCVSIERRFSAEVLDYMMNPEGGTMFE